MSFHEVAMDKALALALSICICRVILTHFETTRLRRTMFWFDHEGDGITRIRAFISLITPNHTGMFQLLGK